MKMPSSSRRQIGEDDAIVLLFVISIIFLYLIIEQLHLALSTAKSEVACDIRGHFDKKE